MSGGGGNNDEMGFQHNRGQGLNCPSSDTNTNPMSEKVAGNGMTMSSLSTFKSSNGADPFYASGWDPLASLSQSQNFGGSSMVSHSEFANSNYPGALPNLGISSASHLVHYPSDSNFGEPVTKLPCFGSGSFSEMVGSFGLSECGQITASGCPPNYAPNKEAGNERTTTNGGQSQDDHQLSEDRGMAASPDGKRRKRVLESSSPYNPNESAEGELQKDPSGEGSEIPREQDEKKQKTEQSTGANLRGKQTGKQTKDNSNSGDGAKDSYIHVRARRGQATNSHSLAERVRREKISERMRLLQELVPGCNKITGKAVMLDEIINYVQSLQQQVEFLSMKLATVNPELNIDIERILSKEVLHSRSGGAAILGFGSGMSSSQPYPHPIFQGTVPGISTAPPHFQHLPQTVLDTELQNLFQMGFDPNSAIDNMGPNGRLKSEL